LHFGHRVRPEEVADSDLIVHLGVGGISNLSEELTGVTAGAEKN
jgi:hypothetical protein